MHTFELIQEAFWRPVARVSIGISIWLPFSYLNSLRREHIENEYALMFFSMFLPTFMQGFILFGIMDYVNIKFTLL